MSAEVSLPTFEDRAAMWAGIDFLEHCWDHPSVDEYVHALRSRYANGSVLFHSFRLPEHPVLDWYLTRQLHDSNFFERFWSTPTPSLFFPSADPALNYYLSHGPQNIFDHSSPFFLAGGLAGIHFCGGAYSLSNGFGIRSKQLGDAAANELIGDDFEDTLCFTSNAPWSDFFLDVAWDRTLIIISKRQRLIHCMLATDTD